LELPGGFGEGRKSSKGIEQVFVIGEFAVEMFP